MRLEPKLAKFLTIFMTMVMLVRSQLYQTPCPGTFEYRRDPSGELYGMVGVYPFSEEMVMLVVQLSVGNHIQNFNGRIELITPRTQVVPNIRNRLPIEYRVIFPRWENIPPKVIKINVNGQDVCAGPPLSFNGFTQVISTVTLNHRFTKGFDPLSSSGNPFIGNELPGSGRDPGGKNWGNNFAGGGTQIDGKRFPAVSPGYRPIEEVFGSGELDEGINVFYPTTTSTRRPSTVRVELNPVTNELFPKNPFFSRGSSPPAPPTPRTTTPRASVRTTRRLVSTPPPPQSPSQCGNPVVANFLVVNGKSVPRGAFPWLTAMFASTGTGVEYKCAGSLVSNRHVITAAHCVQQGRRKISPDKFLFILGKLNIENLLIGSGEKMVGADDIQVHPEYVPFESDADIAVVVLSQVVEFNNYVRPICLWAGSDDIDAVVGQKGKVVGWGRDENNNSMTAEPKQATMPIVSQEQCLRSSEVFKYITSSRTFCAGYRNDSGPCNGDSGSGFIMKRNDRWFLKGIVSISTYDSVKQSCDLSNYVVFTDISKFRTWLLSIIVI